MTDIGINLTKIYIMSPLPPVVGNKGRKTTRIMATLMLDLGKA